jgi:hypothetical protein
MKLQYEIIGIAFTLFLASSNTWAQADKELDITLSIVDEQDSPEAIINRIPLPPPSAVIPTQESVTVSSTANSVATQADEAIETLHNHVQDTTNQALDDASDLLTNTLNDTISTGDLESLPGDIIDKLPEELPDDLLTPLDDIVDDLTDIPEETLPNATESLDSAIDDLENTTELPDNIEQHLPITEPVIPDAGITPDALPEPLPLPVDDLTNPLNQ